MSLIVKDAKEKLGDKELDEVVEKEWKIADLPSEEELEAEKHSSPKARKNPNSRKNLVQYKKKSKETKEKIVKNLQYVETEEDVDPHEVVGNAKVLGIIEKLIPARTVLANRDEQEMYYNYINLLLDDFEAEELTSSDIDDIATLALNQVIIIRLLKVGARNPLKILEASPHIEKFRKASDKIKMGLANRRIDRVDVKNRPAFSIVDLAAHLDEKKKLDFEQRTVEMEKARKSFKPPKRDERGLIIRDDDS